MDSRALPLRESLDSHLGAPRPRPAARDRMPGELNCRGAGSSDCRPASQPGRNSIVYAQQFEPSEPGTTDALRDTLMH